MNYHSGDFVGGKYRIIEPIGGGAMGMIYRAEHEAIHKPVALKVLHGDFAENEEFRQRFIREAQAAASMGHPNICDVSDFDTAEDGRSFYLVMEMLEGETLRARIERVGRFSPRAAIGVMRQLLSALQCAHELGIVHRDVKPDNVFLIQREDRDDFVKLIDFGIAHLDVSEGEGKKLTMAGQIYGTPQYLSPEQAQGEEVDFRADLYACGIILYEMLVGTPPFDGKNYLELLHKHYYDPAPHLPDDIAQYKRLDAIVQKLLSKVPAERYDSAREVIELLNQVDELLSASGGLAHLLAQDDSELRKDLIEILPKNKRQVKLFSIIVGVVVALVLVVVALVVSFGNSVSEVVVETVMKTGTGAVFHYEIDAFDVSFDPILSQDNHIIAATEHYKAHKYELSATLLDLVKDKYWKNPNFIRLYLQACDKLKSQENYRQKIANATIQLLDLSSEAMLSAPVRKAVLGSYEEIFDHVEFSKLSEQKRAVALTYLILGSPYDNHRKRLARLLKEYDLVVNANALKAWEKDAVDIWRIPRDNCRERLSKLEKLVEQYPEYQKDIYLYVLLGFHQSKTKSCTEEGGFLRFDKEVDCNQCLRPWLKTWIESYEQANSD